MSSTKQSRRRVRHDRNGQTLVEFALVAPLMFLLIFACLEFVRLQMLQSLARDAAYEAARMVIVPGATKAEGVAEANRILNLLSTRNATVTVNAYASGNVEQDEITDRTSAVEVSIQVPLASNSFVLSKFTQGKTLQASTRLGFESYDGYYDGVSTD